MAAAGAWLGLEPLPWVVLLAAMLGLGAVALRWALGARFSRTSRLAFGPCLALVIWAARLWP